ncbi:MAG: integrase core domain-containing protein [Spirochaetaceae bacterium]|nr:integrase core domain-containing protein [Spirochaetaceae bacterium]
MKQEYSLGRSFRSKKQALTAVDEAEFIYNTKRPHLSLNYETPEKCTGELHEICQPISGLDTFTSSLPPRPLICYILLHEIHPILHPHPARSPQRRGDRQPPVTHPSPGSGLLSQDMIE